MEGAGLQHVRDLSKEQNRTEKLDGRSQQNPNVQILTEYTEEESTQSVTQVRSADCPANQAEGQEQSVEFHVPTTRQILNEEKGAGEADRLGGRGVNSSSQKNEQKESFAERVLGGGNSSPAGKADATGSWDRMITESRRRAQ